jgi:hypothetical protein
MMMDESARHRAVGGGLAHSYFRGRYSGDLILPPFMVGPRLERMGEISLDGIANLASDFNASVTATAIRTIRMTRQPLILVAHNLFGRNWQWPSITAGRMRVRDDVDSRSSAIISMVGGAKAANPRREPANYWFDRRHVEQFDVKIQSFRTVEGEVLTLLRVLDPKMTEIYG